MKANDRWTAASLLCVAAAWHAGASMPRTLEPTPGRSIRLTVPHLSDGLVSFDASKVRLVVEGSGRRVTAGNAFRSLGPRQLGDLNHDGRVDADDVLVGYAALSKEVGDAGFEPGADLDHDGRVSARDCDALVGLLEDPQDYIDLVIEDLGSGGADSPPDPDVLVASCGPPPPPTPPGGLVTSPKCGGAGTPITLTLKTPEGAYQFGPRTTAYWEGRYLTADHKEGTSVFRVTFDAGQFRESGPALATILLGDGRFSSIPDVERLDGPGVLVGDLTIVFADGVRMTRPTCFMLDTRASRFEQIWYPGGIGGTDSPRVDGPPEQLPIMHLSKFADPRHPPVDSLRAAVSFHLAAAVWCQETAAGAAAAPGRLWVDLVSYGPDGAELSRYTGLELRRGNDDRDPGRIVYTSDLSRPIMMVDVLPDVSAPTPFIFVRSVDGGRAVIVPSRRNGGRP